MNKPAENESRPIVGITQGDINSISYEIIIKAFADNRIFEMLTPIIYGSSKLPHTIAKH